MRSAAERPAGTRGAAGHLLAGVRLLGRGIYRLFVPAW